MARLAVTGQGLTNQTRLDRGITDLMVVQTASGPVLYALSGPNGGVSAYAIGAGGALTLIDFLHFSPSMSESIMRDLALIDTPEGPRLVVGGSAASGLTSFALTANGMIGGEARTPGLSGINGTVLDIGQGDGGALFVTQAGGASLQAYVPTQAGTLVRQPLAIDIPASYGDTIFAMERLSLGGSSFLLGASQTEGGVAAYRITSEGLVASGTLGTAEGIGVMTPTAFRTTMIEDRGFVILGSAPSDGIGRAGAITVMQMTEDGLLLPVDHLLDSRDSRFGNLQSLEVVQAYGFTYVLAAGADGGITLFAMLPNGRLQMLDVLADATTVGLGAISAISAIDMGGQIGVFLGSEAGAGVRVLGFDTAANGIQRMATAAGGTLTGGAGNDILVGGTGNDLLLGGAGDDILEDGGGADTLTGGPGRDIFVLRADGLTDRIADFEPGRDRLDLSGWPFLYDPAQLTVIPTGGGALVLWRTEALILDSMMGGPLTSAQVIGSVIMGAQRGPIQFAPPPDPDQLLQGTSGNDTLDGGAGNDTILGLGGNDQLIGGYDADMLDGGAGRDTLFGSDDNDTLFGGAGFDRLFGGGGFDRLEGGDQADNLFGGEGEDTLLGEVGNDRLFGGADDDRLEGGDGNDFIRGDAGRDTLEGGAGADRLFGGSGFDLLYGGAGNDLVRGGAQADNLFGDDGNDRLFGDIGNDRLFGGAGDDRLFGGGGADRLFGGTGNDLLEGGGDSDGLEGGAGNDTLLGGGGFDRLLGGAGADVLQGGDQADNLFGGGGNDMLMGENGNDRLFGGSGRDLLEGGDGNDALRGNGGFDTLIGGAGNDLLIGGGNWDVFVFEDGHGNDTITDFGATNPFERIDLSSMTTLAAGDFDGLVAANAITGHMGGVTINTGSGSIFLLNTDMDDLDPSDFIF